MATFTIIPSYSANLATQPIVRKAVFGEGYQQRVAKGINTQPRSWSLTFNGDATRLDPVEAFLANEDGVTSFTWTPPTGAAGVWVCSGWSRGINGSGDETVSAVFEEVFGE